MKLAGEEVVWTTSGGAGRGRWVEGSLVEFRQYVFNGGQKRWKIRRKGLTVFRAWAKFILLYGYLPKTVDHINGCSWDDSCDNLRAATYQQQAYNKLADGVKFRKRCTKRPWEALIKNPNNGYQTIGYYASRAEAVAAYRACAAVTFGEYHRAY